MPIFAWNETKTTIQTLRDAPKVVLGGKFVAIQTYSTNKKDLKQPNPISKGTRKRRWPKDSRKKKKNTYGDKEAIGKISESVKLRAGLLKRWIKWMDFCQTLQEKNEEGPSQ